MFVCHAINRNCLFTFHFYLTKAVHRDVTEARSSNLRLKAEAGKFEKRWEVCRDFP